MRLLLNNQLEGSRWLFGALKQNKYEQPYLFCLSGLKTLLNSFIFSFPMFSRFCQQPFNPIPNPIQRECPNKSTRSTTMKNNNKGLTMFEILLSLIIFSIILIMTISIGGRARQRAAFTSALNAFVADFSYARQLASRDNCYVAIIFDQENGATTYEIVKQRNITQIFKEDNIVKVPGKTRDIIKKNILEGEPFFYNTQNFAINSSGEIFNFPLPALSATPTAVPVQFAYQFYKDKKKQDIKKNITIFPSGGIKVEN
jgi:Tfp pilus assembly protein FimT